MASETKKPIYKKWWFWLIVVLVLAAIGVGAGAGGSQGGSGGGTTSSSSAPEPAAIPITATELLQAYEDNGVAADSQYKDQILEVTGSVGTISTDIADQIYVTLEDERNPYAIISVQCYFDDEQTDTLASLSAGDTVTIRGRCTGKPLNVFLEDCTLAAQ